MSVEGLPRGELRAAMAGPRVLIMCNLLLVALAMAGIYGYDEARRKERFEYEVAAANERFQGEVARVLQVVRGTLGLYEASVQVEPDEFRAYIASLDVGSTYAGILAIGYAARVGPDTVGELEAHMGATGSPEFRVGPEPVHPDGFVVVNAEAGSGKVEHPPGAIISRDPVWATAMERACNSGMPAATSPITRADSKGAGAFVVFMPHYRRGASPETPAQRRDALLGYVYAPLDPEQMLARALAESSGIAVTVRTSSDPTSTGVVLVEGSRSANGRRETREITVADRKWTAVYRDRGREFGWWGTVMAPVALAGLAFSTLLYRFQGLQVRARLAAERVAAALRASERRYRTLADAIPELVFTGDAHGRLTYANRRFPYALRGRMLDEALRPLLPADEQHEVMAGLASALERHVPWAATVRCRVDAEEPWRWHLVRVLPQSGEDGESEWIGTLTDIEEQKRATEVVEAHAVELERRVKERTRELERSNQELEEFVAIASHDLQEPLRKIASFGERLQGALGPEVSDEARDWLNRMRTSAQRLQTLIRDLLAFSTVSRAEIRRVPVALESLARGLGDELLEGRTDGAIIRVDPLPEALGDPDLLAQMLENLLVNALKFHQAGTPPRVRVGWEPAGEEMSEATRGAWFRLLVEDEGIGFDPKYLDRIFQMFQRLHSRDRYEGTGVGLAICQRVAELHGGVITARSEPGKGACFIVSLPRVVSTKEPSS